MRRGSKEEIRQGGGIPDKRRENKRGRKGRDEKFGTITFYPRIKYAYGLLSLHQVYFWSLKFEKHTFGHC